MSFSDKILVTTFRQGVVPPPMCSYELQLTSPVNLVTFLCQTQKSNHLAAMTADGQISVFGPGRSPSSPHASSSNHTCLIWSFFQSLSFKLWFERVV